MTWQNDILKKGIRSMQRISDEKIGQAQRIA